MTTVLVGAVLRVQKCPPRLRDALRLRTRIDHPSRTQAAASGRDYYGDTHWNPCFIDGKDLLVPRGMLSALRDQAKRCGTELTFNSSVTIDDVPLVPIEDLGMTPRPYQLEAIEQLHKRVQGIVVLPCGGGKTTVGVLALLSLGQSGLIVVHTRDLLEQWVETLYRAGVGTIRIIGGGRGHHREALEAGEICVAMIQSLDTAPEVLGSAAVVIVDECHHAPARRWAELLARCPARWRWGLTATPDRSDGWGFLMEQVIGPVLYSRTARELIEDGHLRRPLVVPVRVDWKPGPEHYLVEVRCSACGREKSVGMAKLKAGEASCTRKCKTMLNEKMESKRGRMIWSAALSAFTGSSETVRTIRALGVAGWKAGRRSLTLVSRKGAARQIARLLAKDGVAAESMTGDDRGRSAVIEGLRSGRVEALVGTQLADEGLDVAEADLLIMASCGKSAGLTQQRGGRICRPAGHEQPVIFDVVADGLAYQWRSRRAAYVAAYGGECLASATPMSVERAISHLAK